MFKHRLSKIGKATLFALCMLFVGGSLQSCQDWFDDYKYDNNEPDWLGASIYDFLKEGTPGHTYNNFVAIIDSLGERETLAHTGSKTLFVADDAAFEKFFENNPWGVKSVGDMTKAQMKILLYSAMLDNAMLLDMMSSTGSGTSAEGTCLRRLTSASIIDSIPLVKDMDMPAYNKYWDALRGTVRDKELRIAMDGTDPMMVHFLSDYLKNNSIKTSDIEFLFKKGGAITNTFGSDDAMVFGYKVVSNGIDDGGISGDSLTITCKNGYIYRLDNVLLPPSNMAEELRRREDTKVFSHLLDRFCIPVYDAVLTAEYNSHYKTSDSIFCLKYFTKDNFSSYNLLTSKNANPTVDELLNFDPGWNAFQNSLSKERDMAAMFVPNDASMYEYFATAEGAGNFLIQQFAPNVKVSDVKSLIQALDSVPEVNIVPFLNNLMKPTFAGTVLSKFDKITDDANDAMGIKEQHVDECVIANNGVIYILNNVFGPATYQAVSAPTIVFENMLLMRNIIKQLRYDYYLLAMDATYSFVVPDDDYFVYYDPVTFSNPSDVEVPGLKPKAYAFHYNADRPKNTSKATELWAEVFEFDAKTNVITDTLTALGPINVSGSDFGGNALMKNRMTDLMEYLIIVHNDGDGVLTPNGNDGYIANKKKYYQTKGYGTIKVDASDVNNVKFYGGEQIEKGTYVTIGVKDGEKTIYNQKNGITFCTVPGGDAEPGIKASGVPTPPTRSVYTNMLANSVDENDTFYEFFQLCNPADYEAMLKNMFGSKYKEDSLKVYSIFYSSKAGNFIKSVPFFNTYHYTVYIPSNASVKNMFERGLPTWEAIEAISATQPTKAAAAMRLLNNFLRYHFQDNSVYVDDVPFSIPAPGGGTYSEANFSTSVINAKTGRFYETIVRNSADNSTIIVKDHITPYANTNEWAKVLKVGKEGKTWNVMCRDFEYGLTAKVPSSIVTSSFAVLQPIDKALLNDGLFGYDGRFRRYSNDGELVDTMTVAGIPGSVKVGGKSPYLVADYGTVKMKDMKGVERAMRLAYLMAPLNEGSESWNSALTREELVLDNSAKLLITNEGMLVEVTKDEDNNKVYNYVVVDGNRLRVDNAGNVVERIPVAASEN